MAKKPKPALVGTLRIGKDLRVYEKTGKSWKRSSKDFPDAMQVVMLFKAHNNFDFLLDKKNPRFLKGQLSPEGKCQGARINILPDGRKLDKAYSLFARHLTIHDEASNDHWDVLYQNPGGGYAYVYLLEKRARAVKRKYRAVKEFERLYPRLNHRVLSALGDREDRMAVPVYTLLKTCMRVGNEIYYRAHGHKGLTTLKREDVSIKGRKVTFNYIGKKGVPSKITEVFPEIYIKRLREMLKGLKKSSFVFVNSRGHPLRDLEFKEAFKRYCGRGFYPQIVRSFYATKKAEDFLKTHKSASKGEVRELFLEIAGKLGHKRFVKEKHEWEGNFNVTIHHYIQPELVERIKSLAG